MLTITVCTNLVASEKPSQIILCKNKKQYKLYKKLLYMYNSSIYGMFHVFIIIYQYRFTSQCNCAHITDINNLNVFAIEALH